MQLRNNIFLVLLISFLLVNSIHGKSKAAEKLLKQQREKEKVSVFERDIIVQDINNPKSLIIKPNNDFKDTIKQLYQNSESPIIIPERFPKRHTGKTLGYVTPWNSQGYEFAKIFAYKFDFISPTWYHFNRGDVQLKGEQNVDRNWMDEVKGRYQNYVSPKILPRVAFDGWSESDFEQLFKNQQKSEKLIESILVEANKNQFDGIVMDVGYISYSRFGGDLNNFISLLSSQLHQLDLLLFWVIPPMVSLENEDEELLNAEQMETLNTYIDGFSIMTYDFSSHHGRVGPTSPVDWMMRSILRLIPPSKRSDKGFTDKFMLGINFYGREYKSQTGETRAIIANDYIKLLESQKVKFVWEESFQEHLVYFNGNNNNSGKRKNNQDEQFSNVVIYPTLKYLQTRIEIARTAGIGISIWEIGQGMDYFFDLL